MKEVSYVLIVMVVPYCMCLSTLTELFTTMGTF